MSVLQCGLLVPSGSLVQGWVRYFSECFYCSFLYDLRNESADGLLGIGDSILIVQLTIDIQCESIKKLGNDLALKFYLGKG